jgi:hypothetical protein
LAFLTQIQRTNGEAVRKNEEARAASLVTLGNTSPMAAATTKATATHANAPVKIADVIFTPGSSFAKAAFITFPRSLALTVVSRFGGFCGGGAAEAAIQEQSR